jgi:hypothetical protein
VTLSTADKLFLVVGLIDFGGLIACIGFALYLAYTKMKVLLGYFQNSSAVISLATLSCSGPWGKLMVVGGDLRICDIPRVLPQALCQPENLRRT